jgi:acetyltransferase-like isoleucine patch superfamily enzyme
MFKQSIISPSAIASILIGSLRFLPITGKQQWRLILLRLAGVRIDGFAWVCGSQLIMSPQNLRIGAGAFINAECTFEGAGGIAIGAKAHLGPRVIILTTNHVGECHAIERKSVIIGESAWVGAGVTIVPGIIIGSGAVVG